MVRLPLWVPPTVEAGLEGVAESNTHVVDGGPDCALRVSADAICAILITEPRLQFFHDDGQQFNIFSFVVLAGEEEGVESSYTRRYFLPWPWRSIIYLIFWLLVIW